MTISRVGRSVHCRICGTGFIYEAPFDKTYIVSNNAIKGTVITTDVVNGPEGPLIQLDIHVNCPKCNVINLYNESVYQHEV